MHDNLENNGSCHSIACTSRTEKDTKSIRDKLEHSLSSAYFNKSSHEKVSKNVYQYLRTCNRTENLKIKILKKYQSHEYLRDHGITEIEK